MMLNIKNIAEKFFNILFPGKCILCSAYIIDSVGLCQKCWGGLNFVNKPYCSECGRAIDLDLGSEIKCISCLNKPNYFDSARSLLKFDNASKNLIHNIKYNDKTYIAGFLGDLWSTNYIAEAKECDFIVPVPMHRVKRWFRLYNQAQLISEIVGKNLGMSVVKNVLIKSKFTKPQSTLTQKQRLSNLNNSFSVLKQEIICEKTILLVDDVMTTGATLNECAKVLKESGAKKIIVCTLAAT